MILYRFSARWKRRTISKYRKVVRHHPYLNPEDGCLEEHICPTQQDTLNLCNLLDNILDKYLQSLTVDM